MENIIFSLISLIIIILILYTISQNIKNVMVSIFLAFLVSSFFYFNYKYIKFFSGYPSQTIPENFLVLDVYIKNPTLKEKGKIYYWVLKVKDEKIIENPYQFEIDYTETDREKAEKIKELLRRGIPVKANSTGSNSGQEGSESNRNNNSGNARSSGSSGEQSIIDNIKAHFDHLFQPRIKTNNKASDINIVFPEFPKKN
ncbi:MAG: hypothetical protein NZZ41_04085 [Candidatus Dojkabacteria bacterium]|nr:hypothetical protein [Candidatus Dojkabacteria bacterium]